MLEIGSNVYYKYDTGTYTILDINHLGYFIEGWRRVDHKDLKLC
jgi:hypothetical protein